jgi:hypothetical protein
VVKTGVELGEKGVAKITGNAPTVEINDLQQQQPAQASAMTATPNYAFEEGRGAAALARGNAATSALTRA